MNSLGNEIKLVLYWGFVGIPLAWGVVQTALNAWNTPLRSQMTMIGLRPNLKILPEPGGKSLTAPSFKASGSASTCSGGRR